MRDRDMLQSGRIPCVAHFVRRTSYAAARTGYQVRSTTYASEHSELTCERSELKTESKATCTSIMSEGGRRQDLPNHLKEEQQCGNRAECR